MSQDRMFMLLDKIDSKLDKVEIRLDAIDKQLIKYNSELEFHVARTNQIEDDLLPIVKQREQFIGASKLTAALAATIAFIAGIWQLIKG